MFKGVMEAVTPLLPWLAVVAVPLLWLMVTWWPPDPWLEWVLLESTGVMEAVPMGVEEDMRSAVEWLPTSLLAEEEEVEVRAGTGELAAVSESSLS